MHLPVVVDADGNIISNYTRSYPEVSPKSRKNTTDVMYPEGRNGNISSEHILIDFTEDMIPFKNESLSNYHNSSDIKANPEEYDDDFNEDYAFTTEFYQSDATDSDHLHTDDQTEFITENILEDDKLSPIPEQPGISDEASTLNSEHFVDSPNHTITSIDPNSKIESTTTEATPTTTGDHLDRSSQNDGTEENEFDPTSHPTSPLVETDDSGDEFVSETENSSGDFTFTSISDEDISSTRFVTIFCAIILINF